jgi:hypothetical protein
MTLPARLTFASKLDKRLRGVLPGRRTPPVGIEIEHAKRNPRWQSEAFRILREPGLELRAGGLAQRGHILELEVHLLH